MEHKFAGNITINVEEFFHSKDNYQITICDPDNILDRDNVPIEYGNTASHESGGKFYNIPMIYESFNDDSYYVNLSCLDGGHSYDAGQNYTNPVYAPKAWADKFVKAMGIIVDKFIEIGYIERKYPEITTNKFGSLTVTLNKKAPNKVYVTFAGLKDKDELPEEYINGYPMIYRIDGDNCIIKNNKGEYIHSDCINSTYYKMWDGAPKSVEMSTIILNIVSASVERLRKVNEKLNGVKNMEEQMFNGFDKYVESMKYDFYGCIVTLTKTDCDDKFAISINPGPYDFLTLGNNGYSNIRYRLELNNAHQKVGYWFISATNMSWDEMSHYFKDSYVFNIKQINAILKNVKCGAEFKKNEVEEKKKPKPIILLTKEEMRSLINEGELSPAQISLIKWERILAYVKQNKLRDIWDCPQNPSIACALCDQYRCSTCPLCKVDKQCVSDGAAYENVMRYAGGNHEELVIRVEKMVEALKKAVVYVEPEVYKIGDMTLTAKKIDADVYECSIEGMKSIDMLPDGYRCNSKEHCFIFTGGDFTVHVFQGNLFQFSLDKCYPNIKCFKVTNDELDQLKVVLQKCVDNLNEIEGKIELQKCRQTFDFHGVKVTTNYRCGEGWSICIDDSKQKLPYHNAYVDDQCIAFWKSCNGAHQWFLSFDYSVVEHFDNGYINTKHAITQMVEKIKENLDYHYEQGNLK